MNDQSNITPSTKQNFERPLLQIIVLVAGDPRLVERLDSNLANTWKRERERQQRQSGRSSRSRRR